MDLRDTIRARWKRRNLRSHKGDFGRIFILAGSENYSGAPHLTAGGALYGGAGLVTLGVPRAIFSIAASREAEVMVRPFPATRAGSFAFSSLKSILEFAETQDVVAVGPGLSQNPETQRLVRALVAKLRSPLVLDADALNALAGHLSLLAHCAGRSVLTPHPGEFSRLWKEGNPAGSDSERKRCALGLARASGAAVVLKGRHTVTASPEGRAFLNSTGNPGMAAGGAGDVLTGLIAALAGQGLGLSDAARFGVYLHGLAGDLASRETGMAGLTAGTLLRYLPTALKKTLGW